MGSTGGGGYAPSSGGGGGMRGGMKEQDWICPDANCHNKNFGWRQACNRCQVRAPSCPSQLCRFDVASRASGRERCQATLVHCPLVQPPAERITESV